MPNSRFGFERPEDSPGFLLWQTTMSWQRSIKKVLEPHELAHAQFVILAIALWFEERNQPLSQLVLVRWSQLDKMTVSKALKKLAAQGLIKRSENEKDTRAKNVHLTKSGKSLVSKLVPLIEKVDEAFFKKLGEKEQKELIKSLGKLV